MTESFLGKVEIAPGMKFLVAAIGFLAVFWDFWAILALNLRNVSSCKGNTNA